MHSFFKVRVQLHQKHMQRYLKYVFNDHFALLMTFLMGAAGLYYSSALKEVTTPYLPGRFLLSGLWILSISIGRYATLTQPADQLFLLPKEKHMHSYLDAALHYSCYFPFVAGFMIIGGSMPLYVVSTNRSVYDFFYFVPIFWLIKRGHLAIQQLQVFQLPINQKRKATFLFWFATLVSISFAVFLHPFIGLIAALLLLVVTHFYVKRKKTAPIDWECLIYLEQKRMHRMYRFIHLFTDVPQIKAAVKRRKYLDFLLNRIRFSHKNTYFYLFSRSFLRGTEFSGLFLRLLMIGSVILWFLSQGWIASIVAIAFSYLIGFQLIPMYTQFEYLQTTNLYPVTIQMKRDSFYKFMGLCFIGTTLVFGIIGSIHLRGWNQWGILWGGLLVFDFFFYKVYLPKQIKRRVA